MMREWAGARSTTLATARREQAAKCPAGEGLNGSAVVHAGMVPSGLHLSHATGIGRVGAAWREP